MPYRATPLEFEPNQTAPSSATATLRCALATTPNTTAITSPATTAPSVTRFRRVASSLLFRMYCISSATGALFLFNHMFAVHGNAVEGRSIVFASFAMNSMIYIFAYRSMRQPLFRMNRITANKPLIWAVLAGLAMTILPFLVPSLRTLLEIVPLTFFEWLEVAGIALGLLAVVEIGKWISNRIHGNE